MMRLHSLKVREGESFGDDSLTWEEIVSTYSKRIYSLAFKFTGNRAISEELTQEAFLKIFRRLHQYDPSRGELSHWLMRVARNVMIEDYRYRLRNPQQSACEGIEDHFYELRSRTQSPESHVANIELNQSILQAIQRLPHALRVCVVLRDLEELSYKEISDLLHVPEGTVKSRINRGRIELARILHPMKRYLLRAA
jgi:RNA polymerase sigma factor (sigma-70 family)